MGLDLVELVMAIEEAFGVSLSDSECAKAVTPRLLGDLVFAKLQTVEEGVCLSPLTLRSDLRPPTWVVPVRE